MTAEIRFPAMRSTVAGSESTNATYFLGLLGGLDKFSLILKVLTDFNMCSGERKTILYADADKSGPQFFGGFFLAGRENEPLRPNRPPVECTAAVCKQNNGVTIVRKVVLT